MKFLSVLALAGVACARVALEQSQLDDNGINHPVNAQDAVTVPPGICDDVKSIAGYFKVNEKKRYWYWAFASRNNPADDPVMLWMTGGPGCSSQVALFHEHGPCTIDKNHKTTTPNPWSWNANATVIYIDQPAGVGFSTGPADETGEWDIAPQMYAFLQELFEANPNIRNNDFHVFGESYAGHFVPAVSWYISKMNEERKGKHYINLVGIGIGNGMTNPMLQEPQYPEYVIKNQYRQLVNDEAVAKMREHVPKCQELISHCNKDQDQEACSQGAMYCNMHMVGPIGMAGINQYDVREQCKNPPLCYDFQDVDDYLNQPHLRQILGVGTIKWEPCNKIVNENFQADWMVSYAPNVTALIKNGVRVLIYAGDADYICNWMGNKAWLLELEWAGREEFNEEPDMPWFVGEKKMGEVRNVGPVTFLRVFEAGHMVPLDQPQAAQQLFNTFIWDDPWY